MDTARVLSDSGAPGRGPRRHRRWVLAAALAAFAAPLASGSAIAVSGPSGGASSAPKPPAQEGWTQYAPRHKGKRPCHRRHGERGAGHRPEL